jgi:hypothetical protein
MDKFASSNIPDTATPLNSAGTPSQAYGNAAGGFDLKNKYGPRKVKSRKDSDQPKGSPPSVESKEQDDDATKRYFGDFSIEAKRNVQDLLKTHPMFDEKSNVRLNRVQNNTREVLPNDPTITQENGGYRITQQQPQASQTKYSNGN